LPHARQGAHTVEIVGTGRVDEVAGALLARLGAGSHPVAVALGGGRVIDVAKALAGAGAAEAVIAIPTTLSGAEMTGFHRAATGAPPGSRLVRPAVVANDPQLSASQPPHELAASTANAVAHAMAGATAPRATPISASGARSGLERLASGWSDAGPDRPALALGALLAGWAVDLSGLSLHHLLSQTVVRECGIGHGPGNLAMLPSTVAWLTEQDPGAVAWLEQGLGESLAGLAERLKQLAGVGGLADLGVDEAQLARVAAAAAARPDLSYLAPGLAADEIAQLYSRAL
jgi:alcohol dehydrogenase class IV